jgi:hypothetical protein
MELAAASALDPLVDPDGGGGVGALVEAHRRSSQRRRHRLRGRLRALGAVPPAGRRAGTGVLGAVWGTARVRSDGTEEERLRQAVLIKQLEVATYDTIERLARRAGDDATAVIAREARTEDERLARGFVRQRVRLQDAIRSSGDTPLRGRPHPKGTG